jgi:hypothetical protein
MDIIPRIDKTSRVTIIGSLERIAKELITNTVLVVNESKFSFIDLEVYYWHENHPDKYAEGVTHSRPFGEFEIHRYGIDLSLGNQEKVEFGGFLIRGLWDFQKHRPVKKPEVVKTIFNKLTLGSNQFELIQEKTPWDHIFRSKRLNLGEPNDEDKTNYFDALYKFMAKDATLFKNYPDKETIFRNADLLDKEINDFLGYNLKR